MDRVMEGLTELAEFVAARYKDDPGSKHLQSVKRAEIEIERLRAATPAPAPSDGPTYLDFITPDETFDKGPAAVEQWKEAKRAEIERAATPDRGGSR